jgi:hypothetical protein
MRKRIYPTHSHTKMPAHMRLQHHNLEMILFMPTARTMNPTTKPMNHFWTMPISAAVHLEPHDRRADLVIGRNLRITLLHTKN